MNAYKSGKSKEKSKEITTIKSQLSPSEGAAAGVLSGGDAPRI